MKTKAVVLLSAGLLLQACTNPGLRVSAVTLPVEDFEEDTAGAVALLDARLALYTKAQGQAANTRQAFELPSLLAVIAPVTAVALGAGPNVVIAGGAANATVKTGNGYFAPQSKADMYRDAGLAITCLRAVATGNKPIEVESATQALHAFDTSSPDDSDERIYGAFRHGADSVHAVLSQRLASAGGYSAASGLAAEYQQSVKAEEEARQRVDQSRTQIKETLADQKSLLSGANPSAPAVYGVAFSETMRVMQVVQTQAYTDQRAASLEVMQQAIQQCVLRAKG